jgi:hypothetical protein
LVLLRYMPLNATIRFNINYSFFIILYRGRNASYAVGLDVLWRWRTLPSGTWRFTYCYIPKRRTINVTLFLWYTNNYKAVELLIMNTAKAGNSHISVPTSLYVTDFMRPCVVAQIIRMTFYSTENVDFIWIWMESC